MTDHFEKLNSIYQYATTSTRSAFYRNHYGSEGPKTITSQRDWAALPPIDKTTLLATPLLERLFVDYREVDLFRMTSGTTGKKPLVIPRNRYTAFDVHFSTDHPVTCSLNFFQPHHSLRTTAAGGPDGKRPIIISGDPSDLAGSVALAANLGVDHLTCAAYLFELLLPHIRERGLNKSIECIELGGERVTHAQYELIRSEFPHARILIDYGTTEAQGVSSIATVSGTEENVFTPLPIYYWEVMREDGSLTQDREAEGELLITTLWTENNPLPLLRYRTGDHVRIECAHDDPWQCGYSILGRIELDMIKLPGGDLKRAEVERVLHNFHSSLTDDFELHYTTETVDGIRKPQVELRVQVAHGQTPTEALRKRLEREFATRLRVAPRFTYADGVSQGIYATLTLMPVSSFPSSRGKRKRFVRHDS